MQALAHWDTETESSDSTGERIVNINNMVYQIIQYIKQYHDEWLKYYINNAMKKSSKSRYTTELLMKTYNISR